MDNENKNELDSREQWLTTMADMQIQADQRYAHLSRRMSALEQKGKSIGDDPEKMIGSLFMILMVINLLPLLIDMVRAKWVHSESSP